MTHLSIFKLNIQEVKIPKDSELLLWSGVVHVVWFSGPIVRGHQVGLMLHEVQIPTTGKDHLHGEKGNDIFNLLDIKS